MNAPTKPFEATRSDRETRNFMVELIRMVFSTQIDKHLSFDSFGDAHNIKSCRSDRWPMVDEIHLYRRYRTKRPKKSLKVIRDAIASLPAVCAVVACECMFSSVFYVRARNSMAAKGTSLKYSCLKIFYYQVSVSVINFL